MNQVQFFFDGELLHLQGQINIWLRDNREIDVVETHFAVGGTTINVPNANDKTVFVFCILYRLNSHDVMQEQVLAVQEIKELINDSAVINIVNRYGGCLMK